MTVRFRQKARGHRPAAHFSPPSTFATMRAPFHFIPPALWLAATGLVSLPLHSHADTLLWDQSSAVIGQKLWSDFRNWVNPPYRAPENGDRLIFPMNFNDNMRTSVFDMSGELSLRDIRINEDHVVHDSGGGLALSEGIKFVATGNDP